MSEPLDPRKVVPLTVDGVLRDHHPAKAPDDDLCSWCGSYWPCPGAQMARIALAAQERVAALVDALEDLLDDTQHATHNCPDEDCPVTKAFLVLGRERIAALSATETPEVGG